MQPERYDQISACSRRAVSAEDPSLLVVCICSSSIRLLPVLWVSVCFYVLASWRPGVGCYSDSPLIEGADCRRLLASGVIRRSLCAPKGGMVEPGCHKPQKTPKDNMKKKKITGMST